MEYTKPKTKKDKLKESGIPINYCRFHCLFEKSGMIRKVDEIYKATKPHITQDFSIIKKIIKALGITEAKLKTKEGQFKVIKIEILVELGLGKYEE